MKSQDLIEDSSKSRRVARSIGIFTLYNLFIKKKRKKTPCGCNFLFYRPFEVAQSTKGSPTVILVFYRLFLSFGQKLG